jgi:ATP-dependent Lon protease
MLKKGIDMTRRIQNVLLRQEDKKISDELKQKLQAAELPEEGQREAQRELERLALVPMASIEFGIIRTYLDWLASLPWNKLSADGDIDIHRARQVLDEDHYDLDKIKDRIIEYLAVKKLRQERLAAQGEPVNLDPGIESKTAKRSRVREPILCLAGPPGVGKTSLGESIARALGRKFVRTSLAGMHDESEIRGHRRTYTGALPGRIIQALKRVGTRDPVFMLDEIDKIGGDWRGDPAAALLEILDPTQNHHFVDNYIGVPFDCSQVLFITTANALDNIPRPLLDRMEVVRLSGYTDLEKIHIAKMYLVPKQLEAHGLIHDELIFDTQAIRAIIRGYTREAGVRNLDRKIAAVCRKVATNVAKGNKEPVHLTPNQLKTYLEHPVYFDEVAERTTQPGVATGLVWTITGGDIQFIEAAIMPGSDGKLIQTGMLGDVMQESAQIALSYIRSNTKLLNIDPKLLENKAIHLHMPEGAIPKDGPSAGITIMTALVSLLREQSIHSEIAMTGELTLRGKVLAVGGVKEKILAAHRAGIKTIILPRRNETDLDDVPKELRDELHYIFVDTAMEVLQHALEVENATL